MARHVVVCGLMGAGKSTVGRIVATRLGRALLDNDDVLEERSGIHAAGFADRSSLDSLHRRERAVLRWCLRRREPSVVTAAASVADRPAFLERAVLGHRVVFLDAPTSILASRSAAGTHRPLEGDVASQLAEHRRRRRPVYLALAELVVDVATHRPLDAARLVVDDVLRASPAAGSEA